MKTRAILLLAFLMIIPLPCVAVNWIYFTTNADNSSIKFSAYVDVDSIRTEKTYVRGWIKWEYSELQVEKYVAKPFKISKQSIAVDCERQLMAITTASYSDTQDQYISGYTVLEKEWEFHEILPSSIGATITNILCQWAERSQGEIDKNNKLGLTAKDWIYVGSDNFGSTFYKYLGVKGAKNEKSFLLKIARDKPALYQGTVYRITVYPEQVNCDTRIVSGTGYYLFDYKWRQVLNESYKEGSSLKEFKAVSGTTYGKVAEALCSPGGPNAQKSVPPVKPQAKPNSPKKIQPQDTNPF